MKEKDVLKINIVVVRGGEVCVGVCKCIYLHWLGLDVK